MRVLPVRTAAATTSVVCLVLLYIIWWTSYVETHVDERFAQQPPGAAGQAGAGGTTLRLLSLTSAPLLADQGSGPDPEPSPARPGTVWVVAVLEGVQAPGAEEYFCTFELLGPEGRRWERTDQYDRATPSCSSELFAPGTPVRFEATFEVPERFAGELHGIALLDPTTADRVPVITPPA